MKNHNHLADAKSGSGNSLQIGQRAVEAIDDVRRAIAVIAMLSPMPTPSERDFLKNPNLVPNPQEQIAEIKNEFRGSLRYLDKAEAAIAELRALLTDSL